MVLLRSQEKAARLAEMTANASAHDDSRSQRLKREAGKDAAAQGDCPSSRG